MGEPTHWHVSERHRTNFRAEIETDGFVLLDGAISSQEALALRGNCKLLFNNFGSFEPSDTHKAGIRSDAFLSVSESEAQELGLHALASAVKLLKSLAHSLAMEFEREGRMTVAPKTQVAVFSRRGSRYGRHGDNVLDPATGDFANWRAFTIILYCNADWEPAHGGCLRIYNGGNSAARRRDRPPPRMLERVEHASLLQEAGYEDVEPLAGRVVVFNALVNHEVLPSWAPRFAVTLWVWLPDGKSEKRWLS